VSQFTLSAGVPTLTATVGAVTPGVLSPLSRPHKIVADPAGNFIVVQDGGGNVVSYSIDRTTGALTQSGVVGSVTASIGGSGLAGDVAISPDGKWVVAAGAAKNTLTSFT